MSPYESDGDDLMIGIGTIFLCGVLLLASVLLAALALFLWL
jgi:hypothetical protein